MDMLSPTLQQAILTLMAGLLAALITASAIGWALKHFVAGGRPHAVIDNVNARTRAWWVMVLVGVLAFQMGRVGVVALFALLSFAVLREVLSLQPPVLGEHGPRAILFYAVLPLQFLAIALGWVDLFESLVPLAGLALPLLVCRRGSTAQFWVVSTRLLWASMLCIYAVSHLPGVLLLDLPGGPDMGMTLVAYGLLVVQSNDIFQFVCGKWFGRRLMAPQLSPSKTWAGLWGGLVLSALLGAGLHWLTPFGAWLSAGMAVALALAGTAGGLLMSAIKRDQGIKDWGTSVSGHGGFMDRMDSVVLSAPLFYQCVKWGWAGL